jgi:hypothetical protein
VAAHLNEAEHPIAILTQTFRNEFGNEHGKYLDTHKFSVKKLKEKIMKKANIDWKKSFRTPPLMQ